MSGMESGFNMQPDIFKSSGLSYGEHTSFGLAESTGVSLGFDLSADRCVKGRGRRQSLAGLPEVLADSLIDDVFASHGFLFALSQDMGSRVNQAHRLVAVLVASRRGGFTRVAFLGVSGIRRRLGLAFTGVGRVADLFIVAGLAVNTLGRANCDLLARLDCLTQPAGARGMVFGDLH